MAHGLSLTGFIMHYKNAQNSLNRINFDNILDIDRSQNLDNFIDEMTLYFNLYVAIIATKESFEDFLLKKSSKILLERKVTIPDFSFENNKIVREQLKKMWKLEEVFEYKSKNSDILVELDSLRRIRNSFIHSSIHPMMLMGSEGAIVKTSETTSELKEELGITRYYDGYNIDGDILCEQMNKEYWNDFLIRFKKFIIDILKHEMNASEFLDDFMEMKCYLLGW